MVNLTMTLCEFENCVKPLFVKGVCRGHYNQRRLGKELVPLRRRDMQSGDCTISWCYSPATVRSLCDKHVRRAYRYSISPAKLSQLISPAICQSCGDSTQELNIDHDHSCCNRPYSSCGECVRGALCSPCNTALGILSESPHKLSGLLEYISKPT